MTYTAVVALTLCGILAGFLIGWLSGTRWAPTVANDGELSAYALSLLNITRRNFTPLVESLQNLTRTFLTGSPKGMPDGLTATLNSIAALTSEIAKWNNRLQKDLLNACASREVASSPRLLIEAPITDVIPVVQQAKEADDEVKEPPAVRQDESTEATAPATCKLRLADIVTREDVGGDGPTPETNRGLSRPAEAERKAGVKPETWNPYTCREQIAPLIDSDSGPMTFEPVLCNEISETGISFFVNARPTFNELILRLRRVRAVDFRARIVSCRNVFGENARHGKFLVVCQFVCRQPR